MSREHLAHGARIWRIRTGDLDLSQGLLMGVLNVTPDSFSDGGLYLDVDVAIEHGRDLHRAGADLVDVGGESTRPRAAPVDVDQETARVLPVVRELARQGVPVSIDTAKVAVARAAIEAGASVVNDVSAGREEGMAALVAETGVGVVLMHMQGTPRTMQEDPSYDDVVAEALSFLAGRVESFVSSGVDPRCIAIDPGIGFGKTVDHNLEILNRLGELAALGHPLVLGTSRKSFLGRIAGIAVPADRDGVSAVTTALGYERGARIFRVHNVTDSRGALRVAAAIVAGRWEDWSQA